MAAGVKVLERKKRTLAEASYVPEIAKGLGKTMGRFFKNTFGPEEKKEIATVCYPEEKREYPPRFRGIHRLTQRADGSPRCVACLCCSTACPAQCIHIEPAEYEPDDPRYGYERYPAKFIIDELRCIFCGYCVEACPCDAIRMDTGMHMPPSTERGHFLYGKEVLLNLPGRDGTYLSGNPRHEPGDPTHPGVTREQGH
ncbi:MAG TPA: NADH-quinone oxidoreductase subunit I [Polyangiaceae bacterium LLY-WYZ-15_(1-7)]|nr:NADH-quinone oxidoreductase subunit I [Myxococcales bacterium]MAT28670.1 NADH-quinone oxidoreductase subunit I [Sandaracinus sp.]HJK94596.1 NADH-quinone oxidoreductase subunit I [Polyangiaceae bacterium LLY-WYZ-15_(1-7)]HJL05230.1 NADH-quinone oxidoreductase subunit I [Polyangiaceae bacterium LLY-WYZ-15_(1-7)]HJL08257.1 NADH-quinone oxidoreductase subunit I [Polyangiaceae bacterium LLY-WYZ-15_(1-7)]